MNCPKCNSALCNACQSGIFNCRECGHDWLPTPSGAETAGAETSSAKTLATVGGVYLNADCFDRWAKDQKFWDRMPYETRFYFGDNLMDYIQRGILESAVRIMADYPRVCAERDKAQTDLAAALVDARKEELTDEDVRRGTMVFFMWLAGDIVRSNDSLDAWDKCMRKAIDAATKKESV